jgi:hypothetical protein
VKKFLSKISLSILLFVSFTNTLDAKVVINEVLNNPEGEESGAEWVELYNLDSSPKSLQGCILYLDDSAATQKIDLNEEVIDRFKVISWDSRWLNNSGDQIRLECSGESDIVSYGDQENAVVESPGDGITFGRSPDGSNNFTLLAEVTLGEPNSLPPTSTPAPTNSPLPTSKPTSTSAPIITISENNSETQIANETRNENGSQVLSAEESEGTEEESEVNIDNQEIIDKTTSNEEEENIESDDDQNKNKLPISAFILSFFGISLIGVSAFPFAKKYLNKFKDERK